MDKIIEMYRKLAGEGSRVDRVVLGVDRASAEGIHATAIMVDDVELLICYAYGDKADMMALEVCRIELVEL